MWPPQWVDVSSFGTYVPSHTPVKIEKLEKPFVTGGDKHTDSHTGQKT
jgi:hypothetical protein